MNSLSWQINRRLLPCKVHYFLFSGGQAGVLPFLPVIAKHLGISPEVVGVLYTILPLVPMLSNPLMGMVADKLRKLKLVMMVSLAIFTAAIFSIILLPLSPHEQQELIGEDGAVPNALLNCSSNGTNLNLCGWTETVVSMSPSLSSDCNLSCKINYTLSSQGSTNAVCQQWGVTSATCATSLLSSSSSSSTSPTSAASVLQDQAGWSHNAPVDLRASVVFNTDSCLEVPVIKLLSSDAAENLDTVCTNTFVLTCSARCEHTSAWPNTSTTITGTGQSTEEKTLSVAAATPSVYESFAFWWLCISTVVSWVCLGTVTCLTDAIILDNLGDRIDKFGRQRLWGTVGAGIVVILTGYLNELVSESAGHPDYRVGFYIFLIFLFFDQYAIYRMEDSKQPKPQNIGKCIAKLLRSAQIMIFLSAFFVIGVLVGILESFQFWYLEDLGANQLLLGLTRGTQFFGGEMPSFMVAGWVINRIGYVNTITLVLAVYGVRYIGYSFLVNPWYTIALEFTHAAYGIFYSAMAAYASVVAPPGMSATMQAVVGAMYEGAGIGVGGLLGGFLYGSIGGRTMFLYLGIVALGYCVFHGLVQFLIGKFQLGETDIHGNKYNKDTPTSQEDPSLLLGNKLPSNVTENGRRRSSTTTTINHNGDIMSIVTSV